MTIRSKPIDWTAKTLKTGHCHSFKVEISEANITQFATLSGDWNPLHTNSSYAKSEGYSGGVTHGAYQLALVSQSLGMWLVGKRCIIGSMNARFLRPLVYPAEVSIESELVQWSTSDTIGRTRTRIKDSDSGIVYSEVMSNVGFHGENNMVIADSEINDKKNLLADRAMANKSYRPTILITGATGGLLRPTLKELSENFNLIVISRSAEKLNEIKLEIPHESVIKTVQMNLFNSIDRENELVSALTKCKELYAVIHAASPMPNREPLLNWSKQSFRDEIDMGAYFPIELGRLLQQKRIAKGGRLILIGSNWAMHKQPDSGLLTYATVKSCVSNIAKGLARDLAQNGITVNVISPDFLDVGINKDVPSRLVRMKAAENPSKTLCQPNDVLGAIRFLLSDDSRFLSGQEIVLNGGRL